MLPGHLSDAEGEHHAVFRRQRVPHVPHVHVGELPVLRREVEQYVGKLHHLGVQFQHPENKVVPFCERILLFYTNTIYCDFLELSIRVGMF